MSEKFNEGDALELELEGKIFMIHKNPAGEVLSREELDGELVLNALLNVVSDALEHYFPPELLDQTTKEQ